jgi:hypothetical protein
VDYHDVGVGKTCGCARLAVEAVDEVLALLICQTVRYRHDLESYVPPQEIIVSEVNDAESAAAYITFDLVSWAFQVRHGHHRRSRGLLCVPEL